MVTSTKRKSTSIRKEIAAFKRQRILEVASELFARHGEPPVAAQRPRCILPDGEWARTILAPLVTGAGYEIVAEAEADKGAISILFEDVYEVAEALGRPLPDHVIRLRDQPDAPTGSATIYRYDREGLLAALAAAHRAASPTAIGEAA